VRAVPERFRPDPALSREAMEERQREVADAAVFEDDLGFDPAAVTTDDPAPDAPLVAGVDQAFLGDTVLSAVVLLRGGAVLERVGSVSEAEFPYVPGLLSFREGGPALAALAALDREPDLLFFDGSGRIHYRQAGLATHLGVALDCPSLGVIKSLLCGTPTGPTGALTAGERVPVEADGDVEAPPGTVIGHALQTRQYPDSTRINPVYVSPGHRLSAPTACDIVDRYRGGYKLPEPTRLADAYADELKRREG
jgi:deoxyribonuclease V